MLYSIIPKLARNVRNSVPVAILTREALYLPVVKNNKFNRKGVEKARIS